MKKFRCWFTQNGEPWNAVKSSSSSIESAGYWYADEYGFKGSSVTELITYAEMKWAANDDDNRVFNFQIEDNEES